MTSEITEDTSGWYSNAAATFGDRVAGARDALGMTQSELAKRLGVKLKTVRGWEEDLAEPRANKLQMLSGVLNVSLTWLLNGTGHGLAGPADEALLPTDIRRALTELRQVQGELGQAAERLGAIEKALHAKLRNYEG